MKTPVAGPQKELPSRAWMNTRQAGYLIPAACNQLAGLGMHSRCRGHPGAGAGLAYSRKRTPRPPRWELGWCLPRSLGWPRSLRHLLAERLWCWPQPGVSHLCTNWHPGPLGQLAPASLAFHAPQRPWVRPPGGKRH